MEQELIAGLIEARSDAEARTLLVERCGGINRDSIQLVKTEIDRLQRADPHVALSVADRTIRLCAEADDPACTALGSWAKANVLRELGDYAEALACYDRAGQLFVTSDQPVEVAKTRIGKVDALMYLSRYDEATSEAARARSLLLKHHELLPAAKLDANLGNLFHRSDRYRLALQRYNRARRVFSRLGEEAMVAQVDVNRANVFTLLDRFSPAWRAYQKARVIFDRQGMRAVVAMIDANLAFLFYQRGRFSRALELYASSAATFRELGIAKNAAVVELDQAQVYLDLNMPAECLARCDSAVAVFERLAMRAERAQALTVGALARVRTGQHQAALELLAEARSLYEREGNEVRAATADLHRAALLLQVSGDGSSLVEPLQLAQQAVETFQRNGVPGKTGLGFMVVGQIYARQGRGDQAAISYEQAHGIATQYELSWLSYQIRHSQGRLSEGSDPQQARQHYEEAIEILEAMRGELRSENARNFFLGDKLQVYQDLILLLLRSGDDSAMEAFRYVERAKSRALVDVLRGELSIRAKAEADQGLVRRIHALMEELNWYYSRLDDSEDKGHRLSSERLEYITTEVRTRERQLAECVEQLQLTNPEYSNLCGTYAPSPADVQATLDRDEAMVEYYVAGDEVLCFVVTSDSFRVRRQLSCSETVAFLSRRLAFQLSKFNYGERYVADHREQLLAGANDCLARLYDELLRPVEEWIGDRTAIFVPHGKLHALPFHAFYDGEQYFIQRHEVSYSPSAAVLELCASKKSSHSRRCLLVGVSDERAPEVEAEIESIGQFFHRPRRLIGPEATVSALRAQSGSWDLVHIASHAMFSSGNPMFSRLKLADGWLNVFDIYNLRLNASLVTLSSCQTGVGRIVGGDELIGISRGFLYAGAASLLSSLWSVNDSSTARLMEVFYRGLSQGQSKRAALREAQLQIQGDYAHPYYWAPFVLIGASK